MIIDLSKYSEPQTFESDICIIGAGVAGITIALELMSTNKKISLIESGDESFQPDVQSLYKSKQIPEHFPNTATSRLRMLGGSSNHWENSTERFDPIDFEVRDWISYSGWPISFKDIEPYYLQAEEYCGVGKQGYDSTKWLKKFNHFETTKIESNLYSSFSKSASPPTRFYYKYKDKLNSAKNLDLYTNANLHSVNFDEETQQIKQVKLKSLNLVSHKMNAKIFILCLGGIENARILLIFNEQFDNKIGNEFNSVGRYFMEHPVIRGANLYPLNKKLPEIYHGKSFDNIFVKARFKLSNQILKKEKITNLKTVPVLQSNLTLSDGVASSHIVLNEIIKGEYPDNTDTHLMNILKDIDLVADSVSRKAFNYKLFDSSDDLNAYQLLSMIEQTPDPSNKIFLSNSTDLIGLKRISIDYKISDSDKKMSWKSLELLSQDPFIQKLGRIKLLKEQYNRVWGDQIGFSQHHMGTTRMASSAKNGVVDMNCKVFGTQNLYIAGSSIFTTGGHVPPTLTIVALAIRLSKTIKSQLL